MINEEHAATWFRTLSPNPERLRELESDIQARLATPSVEGDIPSLSAEWALLLRERPVANTLLMAAAAAVLVASVPLGVIAATAKLFA
ncbi:MAG: hypothetical protein H6718_04835 [Polyangiaceae bacterium]|nr:hypothetical protein [Polyangiaceae bacterium]MCB9609134.1 hypothetical protein [Polyangiaceae bacterium]